jgi:hypothetical protein
MEKSRKSKSPKSEKKLLKYSKPADLPSGFDEAVKTVLQAKPKKRQRKNMPDTDWPETRAFLEFIRTKLMLPLDEYKRQLQRLEDSKPNPERTDLSDLPVDSASKNEKR